MADEAPSIRLSRAELRAITGAARKHAQFDWCRQNGIPAVEDVRGYPVVLREAVLAKLLPKGASAPRKRTEPDLSALQGRRAANG